MGENIEVETITPEKAGKTIHRSAEYIRAGLRQERFPFGTAVLMNSGQWDYVIIKSKFLEWLGVKKEELNQ